MGERIGLAMYTWQVAPEPNAIVKLNQLTFIHLFMLGLHTTDDHQLMEKNELIL
jgi:hypothetical protein